MTSSNWIPLNAKGCLHRRNLYRALLSILVVGLLVWVIYVLNHPIRFWEYLAILSILSCLIFFVSHLLERQSNFLNTVNLLNSINEVLHSDIEYILFLKSFSSQLRIEKTHHLVHKQVPQQKILRGEVFATGGMIRTFEETGEQTDDVLQTLVGFLQDTAAVIISGNHQELNYKPFAILSSDDDWRHIYETLAKGAKKILILPEPSPSLKIEIDQALSEYRNKLVFIMPRTRSTELGAQSESSSLSGDTRCKRWNEVRDLLPLDLPEYCSDGALLIPATTVSTFEQLPFNTITIQTLLQLSDASWTIQRAFQELVSLGLADHTVNEIQRLTRTLPADTRND